ncbi:alcohol-forming fatty acyl-CoA reductase-like [Wolffia australiana]
MDAPVERVISFLEDKSILITGSTGFLAKMFVEKVLRLQPKLKKLLLLVRASDRKSATHRLHTEVTGTKLFGVLRQQHGKGFPDFISQKTLAVAGDITRNNLGIEDPALLAQLWSEVDVVVNVAATTNFYDRYDVALKINVLGAKNALEFAKKCENLQLFLHVSTAYVCGLRRGLILEETLRMGESLNGSPGLDVDEEIALVEETLKELQGREATEKTEKAAMKELGIKRARFFGWPNTYVFSKALGEMTISQLRGNTPVVIIRPTIITSTLRDPFPGWIEGTRTIDSLIIGYIKGNLTCFLGDVGLTVDVIPGDMVVNAMIVTMEAHANQPRSKFIYHVGTSVSNPVTYATLEECGYRYFRENPRIGNNGKIVGTQKMPVFSSLPSFQRYMTLRYWLPLEGLRLLNAAMRGLFSESYNALSRRYKFVMHLVDLYAPYAFFDACFDDLNLVRLGAAAGNKRSVAGILDCDPKAIDWDYYFTRVHYPGVLEHVLK